MTARLSVIIASHRAAIDTVYTAMTLESAAVYLYSHAPPTCGWICQTH